MQNVHVGGWLPPGSYLQPHRLNPSAAAAAEAPAKRCTRFCCKVFALVADHLREDEIMSQAATWNSPAMNAAWVLMSLPLMSRTCPFLIIAIAS